MPNRAVLYSRVSTGQQAEHGVSLDAQEAMARKHCERLGWEFVCAYTDVMSGTRDKRPELKRMELDATAKKFDHVLVYKTDRIARSLLRLLQIAAFLSDRGIDLISLTEPVDFSTPMGQALLAMLGAFAQMESQNTGRRVRDNMRLLAARGQKFGGIEPLGYKWDKEAGRYLVVPEEVEAVKAAFQAFAEARTLRGACEIVNAAGIPTKTGRQWSGNAMLNFLTNPVYTGSLVWGKNTILKNSAGGKRKLRLSEDKWVVVPDAHERLIDDDLWETVSTILAKNTTISPREVFGQARYAWSGIISCASCGGKATRGGSKGPSPHYICASYGRKGPSGCTDYAYISDSYLDRYAIPRLSTYLNRAIIEAKRESATPIKRKAAPSNSKRIADLQERQERAKQLYVDGLWSREKMAAVLDEVEQHLKQLTGHDAEPGEPGLDLPDVGDLESLWQRLNPAKRGDVLRLYVERCVASPREFTFYFKPALVESGHLPDSLTIERVNMNQHRIK